MSLASKLCLFKSKPAFTVNCPSILKSLLSGSFEDSIRFPLYSLLCNTLSVCTVNGSSKSNLLFSSVNVFDIHNAPEHLTPLSLVFLIIKFSKVIILLFTSFILCSFSPDSIVFPFILQSFFPSFTIFPSISKDPFSSISLTLKPLFITKFFCTKT